MKKLILLFLLLPLFTRAQFITNFAGTGLQGYGGDGGPATAAEFASPSGIMIDDSGNIYIADNNNYRVRKVDTAGIITTIAGIGTSGYSGDGGPATAAGLTNPLGVAIDDTGSIFIADDSRIREVDTAGNITTIAGTGTYGHTGDGGPATAAELWYPSALAFDGLGNMYITETGNNDVRKIDPTGIITTIAGNGTGAYNGDGGPATAAELFTPNGVVADNAGNIYIADMANARIRKVDFAGIITTFAGYGIPGYGGDGGPAIVAELDRPWGLAIDIEANIYVADVSNARVRKINPLGVISTIAGNGIPGDSGDGGYAVNAQLDLPIGIAVPVSGSSVYISDAGNYNVRKLVYYPAGISNVQMSKYGNVEIYPNPATDLVNIEIAGAGSSAQQLVITNLLGQAIFEGQMTGGSVQVDVSGLPSGMYLVRVSSLAVLTVTGKFVKE